MNGDILTTLDYSAMLEFHRLRQATATIAVFSRPVRIDLGVVKFDAEDRLLEYIEKPTLHYQVSMGISILEPRVLDFIPQNDYLDLPTLMINLVQAGERVVGYQHEGYWLDLGRKEDYERAVEDFDQLRATFLPD